MGSLIARSFISVMHRSKPFFKNENRLYISTTFLDYVFFLSVIILFIVVRIFGSISPFAGVYFYLIIPYIVGESFCKPLFEDRLIEYFGKASKYYLEWIFGLTFFTLLFAILQVLKLNFLIKYVYSFVFISIALNILMYLFKRHNKEFYIVLSNDFKYLLLSILTGISVVTIMKIFFLPVPNIGFNFDIPYTTYLTTVRLLEEGYVSLVWRWVDFTIPGIVCPLLNLDPLVFIAVAPFSMIILYTAGVYLSSYILLKNHKIAFVAVLLSIFINTGSVPVSMFIDNLAYAYRSNTILASIVPLSLFLIVKLKFDEKINKTDFLLLFSILLSATLLFYVFFNVSWIHVEDFGLPTGFLGYYVFPIVSFSLFIIAIFLAFHFKNRKIIFITTIFIVLLLITFLTHSEEAILLGGLLSLFCFLFSLSVQQKRVFSLFIIYNTILFIILQACGIISKPLGLYIANVPLPVASYLKTGFEEKWNLFFDTNHPYNTYLLLFFLAISIIFALIEKNDNNLTVLSSTWSILLLFFLPELFTYRSYHILTPLMGITLAYMIDALGQKADLFLNKNRKKLAINIRFKSKILRISTHGLIAVFLLILLSPLLFLPFYSRYSFFPEGSESNSYFANYDYKVATWIRQNTPKNTIILSDYFSMKLYQGLSSRPLLFSGLNSGEESAEAQAILWFIKQDIFLAHTSEDAYNSILSFIKKLNMNSWIPWPEKNALEYLGISLTNPDILIVINPRTCVWLKQESISDVRPPYYDVDPTYLQVFNDSNYFRLVYKFENKVYIFKPTNILLYHASEYPSLVGQNYGKSEIAHWSFSEINGSILIDRSEYKNNGIIYGANKVLDEKLQKWVLSFDGVDDYVEVPHSTSLATIRSYTISAWVKRAPDQSDFFGWVVGKHWVFYLGVTRDGNPVTRYLDTSYNWRTFISSRTIPANVWTHIVAEIVEDGSNSIAKIYINGSGEQTSLQGYPINDTDPLRLGAYSATTEHFKGEVQEVIIYNRALTEDEIKQILQGKYVDLVRKADAQLDPPGYLVNIPLRVTNPEGTFKIEIKIKAKVTVRDHLEAFRVELYDNTVKTVIYNKTIYTDDFRLLDTYELLELGVIEINQSHDYDFRVYFIGNVDVWIDVVIISVR